MGLLRKNRDYADYTALQKRGLLKFKDDEKSKFKMNKDGFIELKDSSLISESTNVVSNFSSSSQQSSSSESSTSCR